LVYLEAVRRNPGGPPLLQVGLAACSARTRPEPIALANQIDPDWVDLGPSLLLDPRSFHAPDRQQAACALAGVFTEFLIREFGWDRFWNFYRVVPHRTFRRVFQRHFGLAFEDAWGICFDEMHVSEPEAEDPGEEAPTTTDKALEAAGVAS
jgi:hypothetical protein